MSTVKNVDNIVVNVDFQRRDLSIIFANEVQVVPGDIAWEDLELMLKIYSGHEHVKVSYADDDNDQVVIGSEDELKEAFKVARKCNNTLKLMVICENRVGKRSILDPEQREPLMVPLDDFHLLEMSPGRVLYKRGLRNDESWLTPRGSNMDDRSECHGDARKQETAVEELDVDSSRQKSFFIINRGFRSMVLDVEGSGTHPGARVIVWYRKRAIEGIMNQLWYEDYRTATIRTRLNDFCLDVIDGHLVVNPCDLNSISQKWTISGSRIQNVFNQKWVIGLNKDELSACDQVLGRAEEELTNKEWIVEDPERSLSEFCGNLICGNLVLSNNVCSTGVGRPYVEAICDICDRGITGVRYKCGFCPDFDLCASCESKDGVHDPTHLLLKMCVSQDRVQLKLSALEPVLIRNGSGCIVADPRHQITEYRLPKKNPKTDEQLMMQQIVHHNVEVIQENPSPEEADNEGNVKDVVGHSESDELSLGDLLDVNLDQLKITSPVLNFPKDTPLADTAPVILELDETQLVPEGRRVQDAPSSCEESLDHVNMAIMADLVRKKMSDIVTDGEYEYVDVERVSNSSSSTSDFYVVPIPDCFNPHLPARKEASTTVIVKKSAARGSCSLKSVDGMLSTSSYLATEALLSPQSCFSVSPNNEETKPLPEPKRPQLDQAFFEMVEIKPSDIQHDVGASGGENTEKTTFKISEGAAVPELEIWQTEDVDNIDAAGADSSENSGLNEIINKNDANEVQEMQQQEVQQQQDVQQQQQQAVQQQQMVVSNGNQVETERNLDEDAACSASSGVEASTVRLMSSVFSFVTKTAKGVFTTLQDKNSYIPPRSSWTPAQNQWTPAVSTWTPQPPTWAQTITPQWNPAPGLDDTPYPPVADFRSPMDQLIEMGFADRQLNQQLFLSCGNNIETVIQKLVEINGNIR